MSAVPQLGDISLAMVQRIEHHVDAGFVGLAVPGLAGEVQQQSARRSHQIRIAGVLAGEAAADQLKTLQQAANDGAELTFAADITTALELQRVVVREFRAVENAGSPGRYGYEIALAESPPLPPPAEVFGFGGLDDFGLGDLGFDTDLLGDLSELADLASAAIDAAQTAMDALGALAALGDLGGLDAEFLSPIQDAAKGVGTAASTIGTAASGLAKAFGQ